MVEKQTFRPDQGYSWVVLIAAFMLDVLYAGGVGAIGVFLAEFIDHFQVSKTATSILAGLLLCVGFLLGFPIGWLCRHFGYRTLAIAAAILAPLSLIVSAFAPNISMLYFTYGCLTSVSLTTFHNTGSIAIQKYFNRKRAMASGVAVCGVGVGVFLWAPFTRWTIDLYGWRGAMVISAGVELHALIFALLLRPAPATNQNVPVQISQPEKAPLESKECKALNTNEPRNTRTDILPRHSTNRRLPSDEGYCCRGLATIRPLFKPLIDYPSLGPFVVGVTLIQAGHISPYSLLPTRAKALHIDKTLAATLVSMIGIASLCGRLAFGFVGDVKYINRTLLCGMSGVLAGACTALSLFLTNYTLLAIYSCILGMASAPYIALQAAAVVDILGVENAELAIGYLSLSLGMAHFMALSLSGFILDQLKDPKYAFLVFGSGEVLGGFIIMLTASANILRKRKASRSQ